MTGCEIIHRDQALEDRFAHIAPPADATECEPWVRRGVDDWRRLFITREWDIGGIWVSVAGEQDHHGDIVARWMHVGGEDRCTTSDRKQLIAALDQAGQLLDALTTEGPVTAGPR